VIFGPPFLFPFFFFFFRTLGSGQAVFLTPSCKLAPPPFLLISLRSPLRRRTVKPFFPPFPPLVLGSSAPVVPIFKAEVEADPIFSPSQSLLASFSFPKGVHNDPFPSPPPSTPLRLRHFSFASLSSVPLPFLPFVARAFFYVARSGPAENTSPWPHEYRPLLDSHRVARFTLIKPFPLALFLFMLSDVFRRLRRLRARRKALLTFLSLFSLALTFLPVKPLDTAPFFNFPSSSIRFFPFVHFFQQLSPLFPLVSLATVYFGYINTASFSAVLIEWPRLALWAPFGVCLPPNILVKPLVFHPLHVFSDRSP